MNEKMNGHKMSSDHRDALQCLFNEMLRVSTNRFDNDKPINKVEKLQEEAEKKQKGSSKYEETFVTCPNNQKPAIDHKATKSPILNLNQGIKLPKPAKLYAMSSKKDQVPVRLQLTTKIIGRGSFSTVYEGIFDGDVVAVKKMKLPDKSFYENEKKRFEDCKHKNIVSLIHSAEMERSLYLVFEFMPNGTLMKNLESKNPIPWSKRLTIAADVANGLAFVHIKQYVHRDVKSSNILLSNDWTAKLGDFGIVHDGPDPCMEKELYTASLPIGTPIYMAKEASHGIISEKLDTFSYGVVLLELLSGKHPSEAKEKLGKLKPQDCTEHNLMKLLDRRTNWKPDLTMKLFCIARFCLTENHNKRPAIFEILREIQSLSRKAQKFCNQ